MEKKVTKIFWVYSLALMLLLCVNSNAQESKVRAMFKSESQITEWGNAQFGHVDTTHLVINDRSVFILIGDTCSGLYCYSINIFKQVDGQWQLAIERVVRTVEMMTGKSIETYQEKVVFRTISGKSILEIPFKALD